MLLELTDSNNELPILNLFGLSLYMDDIIIIGLLYLLFTEKNDDTLLYICLIYLLLN